MRAIAGPLIVVLIIMIAIDCYIVNDLRCYVSKKRRKAAMIGYGIFAVLCWTLLIVTLTYPIRDNGRELTTIMWMLYTSISLFVPKVIYAVFSLIGRLVNVLMKEHRKHTNYFALAGVPLGLLAFIFIWWGALFTRNEIEVTQEVIESDKIPASFNGFKIVQFSDAHVGTWGKDTTFISEVVKRINAVNPDMIVFTGDIVSRETSEMQPFLKTLSGLHAPYGVYSVLGNHDYGDYITWKYPSEREANNALMAAWQKQIGWTLLNNEHRFITNGNDSIVLIGVENWGEPPFKQYGRLTDAYPLNADSVYNLNDNRYKILLSHNPEHWNREVSKISNIDLTLSGHTHAMQMLLKFGKWKWTPSQYIYEQWGGLYERMTKDNTPSRIYVNIGIGEVAIPSRMGAAYPELTEIILRHKKSDTTSSGNK